MGVLLLGACSSPAVTPGPAPVGDVRTDSLCVVRDGRVGYVRVSIDPVSGDTLVSGRRLPDAIPAVPPEYAAGAEWYGSSATVPAFGVRYVRHGPERTLRPDEVVPRMRILGVFAFTPAPLPDGRIPEFLLFAVRPGCVFQLYQGNHPTGAPHQPDDPEPAPNGDPPTLPLTEFR